MITGKLSDEELSAAAGEFTYSTTLTLKAGRALLSATEHPTADELDRHQWTAEERLDFEPTALAARHPSEFYIVGERELGELVFERWDIDTGPGSILPVESFGTPVLGTASPLHATAYLIEGEYAPPMKRADPVFARSALALPADWLWVRELGVDPEGRFLLALVETSADDSTLFRYDLANETATALADGEAWPALIVCENIQFADLEDGTRVVILRTTGKHRLLLFDAQNDGIFEDQRVQSWLEFNQEFKPTISRTR